MTKRFPLTSAKYSATATLYPEFEALYSMIRADMPSETSAAAYFINCLQNIASGTLSLEWYEAFERSSLTLRAAKTYTNAA